jgi:ABC-2 type transport system ATP-binding protein
MEAMIEVKDLRRSFGPIVAVDQISFRADKGEVVGILGPNGAGKSTAMKMLTGFLEPDSGTASICGKDVVRRNRQVRHMLGYLAENAPLYDEMTVASFLKFICDARGGIPGGKARGIDRAISLCALEPVRHQTIETLSKGYRRRVGLAQALVHDPPVLILDEPTDGLDPNQKHEVRELIRSMAREKCILISTHILEEVEAVCSRAMIMARGKILVDSTPARIREEHGGSLDEAFRKITAA